ncbi:MAG TPA: hypothetical protein VI336_01340 [Candidatus Saccharimonadales bacterium]|nr:hypothetical protein [Candidatus Saccharimonadales bacterium]
MHYARKVFLVIAAGAAAFFLFMMALDTSIVRVIGSPEPIKKILADSGIYESAISSTLEQIGQEGSGNGEVAFGSQIVVSAADATLSGQYLKATVDGVLDSIYRWLDGSTQVPDFRIDLSAKKEEFAKKVAAGVEKHVAGLPACKTAASNEFDAFSAKCRPAGLSASSAAGEARREILRSEEFLKDTVITADDFKAAGSNEPFFTGQLKDIPAAYQSLKASPLALGVAGFLALTAVFFLSSSRLVGLRNVGFILIGAGIFFLLLGSAVNALVDNKILPQISLENAVFEQDLRQLVGSLSSRVSNTLSAFGGGYSILGGISVGTYYFVRHRQPASAAKAVGTKKK